MAQLDFRWGDDPSDPRLIELNPRFFGGLPQAIAAGVDYPWLAYRLALGLLQDSLKVVQRTGLFECQIIGPSPSPTERRAGRYRFQTQIMADARSNLHKLLSILIADLDSRRQNKKLRWHLDIDPISLD